jgi:hypothetical protein
LRPRCDGGRKELCCDTCGMWVALSAKGMHCFMSARHGCKTVVCYNSGETQCPPM